MPLQLQYSIAVINAKLDAIETVITTAAWLGIKSGAPPATVATAESGTILASITLPADWMAAASAGSKAKLGTWQDTSADNTGTAGHFRIYTGTAPTTTTPHMQGTVGTATSDMIVDNVNFNALQSFTINSFTLTGGNA